MERLIVLDTETTGIRPEEGHRIIEIGAVQILNREITLYQRLLSKGYDISFITFGNKEDLTYIDLLGGIKILCNKWGFPKYIYNNKGAFKHHD